MKFPLPTGLACVSIVAFFALGLTWLLYGSTTHAEEFAAGPNPDLIRVIPLVTNDLVINPADAKLYVSSPSSAPNGNSIRRVDPSNLAVSDSVWVGSEPNKLAMGNDGSTLYVHLEGASSIRRFNTSTMEPGQIFGTGGLEISLRYNVSDVVVSPDDPGIIAVSRLKPGTSPPGGGVAIFNNGVQLPLTTPDHSASKDFITFSDGGSVLYGASSGSGLGRIAVTANGATISQNSGLSTGQRIKFAGGKIFSSTGQVIDAASMTQLGVFPSASSITFTPDAAVGRAYYLTQESSVTGRWVLRSYNIDTLLQVGSLLIDGVNGSATNLVRWGSNGLAFRSTGGQLFVIQTALVPGGEPVPSPTATPIPSPSPTQTPYIVNSFAVDSPANDLVYDAASQKMYMSVPSSAGAVGNSIRTIDMQLGTIVATAFVGSEPNKLVLGPDGQTLWVGLDGARAVRRFNTDTMTAGLQFPVGVDDGDGPLIALDIAGPSDSSEVLGVSRCATGVSPCTRGALIFDSGVARPNTKETGGAVAFGADSSVLYAAGPFSGLTINQVSATGINSQVSTPFSTGQQIRYHAGAVYSTTGQVIDPASKLLLGRYQLPTFSFSRFVIDGPGNRIFFLTTSPSTISAYELDTMRPIGKINVPQVLTPTDIVRFGDNGLAISQSNGPVVILRSNFVNPSTPIEPWPPAPTPTPTPTPTPAPAFIRKVVQRTNDIAFNSSDGHFYASVPGAAGAPTGNSITKINPVSGQIVSSVAIGSEPRKLAMSSNGATLYTTLGGTNTVRQFDVATQTPGSQFTPHANAETIRDMKVVPGTQEAVVISAGQSGTAIYDSGVRRPNFAMDGASFAWIGPMLFTEDPSIFYGYVNVSSGFELYTVSINSSGLLKTAETSRLITGFGNADMRYLEGKIFTQGGSVVDPVTRSFVGTISAGADSVAVDGLNRRVFHLSNSGISVHDMDTFRRIGTISWINEGGNLNSLTRWGTNGLAFRITDIPGGDAVVFVQSPLVSNAEAIPTGVLMASATQVAPEATPTRVITVARNGDLSVTSSINYATANGTASAGADYTAKSGTLIFNPGETAKSIVIPILNDSTFEGNENFTVNLSEASGGLSTLLSPSTTTVTITDNDQRPSLTGPDTSTREGGSGITLANVQVNLSNPSVETVSVSYSTASGTATSGVDFVATSGTLTFEPGSVSKAISVNINGDLIPEGNENFVINLFSASNGTVADGQIVVTIEDFVPSSQAIFDYDGDGKSDVSVWRPSTGTWYVGRSGLGDMYVQPWGLTGDAIVPADYDGDGKTDLAVRRPSDDNFYVFNSSNATVEVRNFGIPGDIAVPSDYNGDGKADVAVWRPSNGTWYLSLSGSGIFYVMPWGLGSDKPAQGDFDGDGKTELVVFRPSDGEWYMFNTVTGTISITEWGLDGDRPVQGDYNGDGRADFAVYRPSNNTWYRQNSNDGALSAMQWGSPNDLPVPGDYDGDGKIDIAFWRPSDATWNVRLSTSGIYTQTFGLNGDTPTPSAFVY